MKIIIAAAAFALLTVTAAAQEAPKSVTLILTQEEAQALAGLMDAGVRATGLRSVDAAAVLTRKLDEALKASQQPAPEPEKKEPKP